MKKVLKPEEKTMEKIVALCKNRGYVYPGSEIYGGLSNSWDYGPLGCLFKDNVKNAWKRKFVQESRYNVALDSAILMNPEVWVATGHVGGFSDPLMDCKDCKTRHRADKLIEDFTGESADGWTNEQMQQFIADNNIACPECGGHNFTDIRQFNLMFKTFQGVTEDAKSQLYLRPETPRARRCRSAFVRWARASEMRLPRATSFSAFASLSRWSANSSASRARTSTGSTTGKISAKTGF